MGVVGNIDTDKFPKQSANVGKRVAVAFHYKFNQVIHGTLVRDDREDPWMGIIKLDDDRYIETSECQFRFLE